MDLFGLSITRRSPPGGVLSGAAALDAEANRAKAAGMDLVTDLPTPRNGFLATIREAFAGAWQKNVVINHADVMSYATVWACQTLIAADISKIPLGLVRVDANGIWTPYESPTFSPPVRKPNRYQTRIKFIECWVLSRMRGNAYILKERDGKNAVRYMHVLDPSKVQVLVAPDGSVFYQLAADNLAGIHEAVTVPASEMIHDVMVPLYHPLNGIGPIHACGLAATQALKAQNNSARLFQNGSQPSGVLTAPQTISNETAQRMQEHWEANYAGEQNIGKVAVLGDGLKFEQMMQNAVDSQLVEQLKWSDEKVCAVHHVPPYMVGVGPLPTYNNIEALNQQYYSQALQHPIECIELLLDEGMGLPPEYGYEFDIEGGLLRMDTLSRVKAAADAIKSGGVRINEARRRWLDYGPMPGGENAFLQEQNWPVQMLAAREMPVRPPTAPAPVPDASAPETDDDDEKGMDPATAAWRAPTFTAELALELMREAKDAGLYDEVA